MEKLVKRSHLFMCKKCIFRTFRTKSPKKEETENRFPTTSTSFHGRFSITKGFWDKKENYRKFLDFAAQALGIKHWEDWYKVSEMSIRSLKGWRIIEVYGYLCKALPDIYSEHPWQLFKFRTLPSGFWINKKNHKQFMEWFAKESGIQKYEDWYDITGDKFRELGGGGLLTKYRNSVYNILKATFPEHNWIPWKFKSTPRLYWVDKKNHREFFDQLTKKLNIKKFEDWYEVKPEEIIKFGGIGLFSNYYGYSLYAALSTVYPEYQFQAFKFKHVGTPKGYWNDVDNVRLFLDHIGKKLNIEKLDDWHHVTTQTIANNGGATLLARYGGWLQVLSAAFPLHDWGEKITSIYPSKRQMNLFNMVKQLAPPNVEIYFEYPHPDFFYKTDRLATGKSMRFDVFFPTLNIAIEYQGYRHYEPKLKDYQTTQDHDKDKFELCNKLGITMIHIPYWWDGSFDSLKATLYEARPDVFLKPNEESEPISKQLPAAPKKRKISLGIQWRSIPWKPEWNPIRWWVTEKIPGIFAYWNGSALFLRNGEEIKSPDSFTCALPSDVSLAGVLHLNSKLEYFFFIVKDGNLQELTDIIISNKEKEWSKVRFKVFDVPTVLGTIEERMQILNSLPFNSEVVSKIEAIECIGESHLKELARKSEEKGNLGLYLRRVGNDSNSTFKLEFKRMDYATFIGKNKIQIKDGSSFDVKMSEKMGRVVLIAFPSEGEHISPSILRICKEMNWNQVTNLNENIPPFALLSGTFADSSPLCKGCGERIPKKEPRISTHANFVVEDSIRTTLFSFHVDTSCIRRARDLKYGRKKETPVNLPKFDGKVFVPPETRSEESFKILQKPQDIEWIFHF